MLSNPDLPKYGPIIGDLPLLRRHPAKLSWEEGNAYRNQLQHQCIRVAWIQSKSIYDLQLTLELITGRASIAYDQAMGFQTCEQGLRHCIEANRCLNFRHVCFGFLLDEYVASALANPKSANIQWLLEKFLELESLHERFQWLASSDALAAETIRIVERISGLPHYLSGAKRLEILILKAKVFFELFGDENRFSFNRALTE